jgi:hypothetical protein
MLIPPVHPVFLTPNTPDLGCFVRRKHEFQVDADFHLWTEFPPWDASGYLPRQAYFRVKCGRAAFHERVKVWMRRELDPTILAGLMPDWVLGGDFRPYPSDWLKFPPQTGEMYYFFSGEYRDPSRPDWQNDASVGHIYDNGTLSTVGWDDTGGDRDYDDVILEVAIVRRKPYFDVLLPFAAEREADVERFAREDLPKFVADRGFPGKAEGAAR